MFTEILRGMTKTWSIVSLTCFWTGIEGKAAVHGLFVDVPFRLRERRVEQTASYLMLQFGFEGEAKVFEDWQMCAHHL